MEKNIRDKDSDFAVTTSAGKALNSNPDRIAIVWTNNSASDVLIWPKNTVTTTRGIRLVANGGAVSMTKDDDQSLVKKEWWAISNNSVTISILEVLRDDDGEPDTPEVKK